MTLKKKKLKIIINFNSQTFSFAVLFHNKKKAVQHLKLMVINLGLGSVFSRGKFLNFPGFGEIYLSSALFFCKNLFCSSSMDSRFPYIVIFANFHLFLRCCATFSVLLKNNNANMGYSILQCLEMTFRFTELNQNKTN